MSVRVSRIEAFATLTGVLSFAGPGLAADPVTLPEVTVNAAAPAAVPQEAATTAATTIDAATIETEQMRGLEDALSAAPGLTLSGQRGVGQPRSVSLRGLGARNVRFFIDGIEMSDTSQSQSQYPISELNMADVEKVEVLRGPQPGIFGPDAGGGVITITTKRPTKPFAGEAGAEYGRYGTVRSWGAVSGLWDTVDYRLSASGTRSSGYSDFNRDRGGGEADPYQQWSVGGRVGVQATEDFRIEAVGRYQEENLFYDSSSSDVDWNRDETERFARVSGTLNTLDGRLVHTLGVANTAITRQYWGRGTKGDTYDGYKTRIDYAGALTINPRASLRFGTDATRESMEQHTPGFAPGVPDMASHFWRNGAYVTAGVTPLEALDLTATARGDHHTDFGSKGTWRLGAAYTVQPTATTVHTSYGTAWQTPSLYERYDPCYGNSGLHPESSKGWDAGVRQSLFGGRLSADATYYRARTQDQINWLYGAPASAACPGGGYVNVDRTRSQGLEVEVSVRPLETVDLRAAYSWQEVENAVTGLRLARWPRHQASASAGWRFLPEATVNAGLRWRDTIDNYGKGDAFAVADIRLSYEVRENLTLFGRVENLLDARYEEEYGYGTPGRSVFAGVSARF